MFLRPPTDNLYKFMAIFGLILAFVGGPLPWVKSYELLEEVVDLEAAVEFAKWEMNQRIAKNIPGDAPAVEKAILLDAKIKKIRLKLTALWAFVALGFMGVAIGAALMYFGFRWWFVRVQRPLDNQLAKEVGRNKGSRPRAKTREGERNNG